jgi:hypothetical protein
LKGAEKRRRLQFFSIGGFLVTLNNIWLEKSGSLLIYGAQRHSKQKSGSFL